ncbi:MAG: MotA/TolQ/ExbB proton channel family protein [Planctomycetaceae bacterium]|nr:MotA/TolQ/ExbB proton channel family protein [Planctomycetaceae bacterium]
MHGRHLSFWQAIRCVPIVLFAWGILGRTTLAADRDAIFQEGAVNPQALLRAGGPIGYVIIALSVAMVALIIEHLLSIRRGSLMPRSLAESLHQQINGGQLPQAEQLCKQHPTFLSYVVSAGLREAPFGYTAIEKGMEDAAVEQAARLTRKIEYLSLIGNLAPMLGLMGTVWGMIQAFAEFTEKANPMPADFAPAISQALVTTLFGLVVAVPALAAYSWFRNRIDEYVAETTLMAEHLITPLRKAVIDRRKSATARGQGG